MRLLKLFKNKLMNRIKQRMNNWFKPISQVLKILISKFNLLLLLRITYLRESAMKDCFDCVGKHFHNYVNKHEVLMRLPFLQICISFFHKFVGSFV